MAPKDRKGKGKGKGKGRAALSLDSSFGNLSLTPRTQEAQSPAVPDEGNCGDEYDVIGYDRVTVQPDTSIEATAQSTFDTVMAEGSLTQIGDRLAFGNSLGHMVLAEREDLLGEMKTVKAQLAGHDKLFARNDQEISDLRKMVSDLQAHSEVLKESSDRYMQIRARFLDTFLRDVEKIPEARWSKAITEGNKAAHDGDAVADANLFESGSRNDDTLMVKIYGLSHRQVLTLKRTGDYGSISLVNARATLKANKERPIPPEIDQAWGDYVFQLEQNWGTKPGEEPLSRLTQAYHRFWEVYGRHKK